MTASPIQCKHLQHQCVNHYEFVRKYECLACGAVMMCACDREFGEAFLPHQLDHATELESGAELPVTLGFQPGICRTCRGLPEEPHPMGEIYGRSTKVVRYYWREIFFETTRRFAEWASHNGYDDHLVASLERRDKYSQIEREVIREIKELHKQSPKYNYSEESAADVLSRCGVDVVDLKATYLRDADGVRRLITGAGEFGTPEEVAADHFSRLGFSVLDCESRPFHVLFGVYMWLLVQDPDDPLQQIRGFGDRAAFEAGDRGETIWTYLPTDFGNTGFGKRRAQAIDDHLALLDDDLIWLFDYWLDPSANLRQYLWAHRDDDVARGRKIVEILPAAVLRQILRYLVECYWGRYLGWPDLLACDSGSFFFAEVKGTGDKLSENQKQWIKDNTAVLHLPFKLVKIHRVPERS